MSVGNGAGEGAPELDGAVGLTMVCQQSRLKLGRWREALGVGRRAEKINYARHSFDEEMKKKDGTEQV